MWVYAHLKGVLSGNVSQKGFAATDFALKCESGLIWFNPDQLEQSQEWVSWLQMSGDEENK